MKGGIQGIFCKNSVKMNIIITALWKYTKSERFLSYYTIRKASPESFA